MKTSIALLGGATLALAVAALLAPTPARAQPPYPCSGHVSYTGGHYVVQDMAPAGGISSQCAILVTPGGMQLENGGDKQAFDGVDAPHESEGHGT